MVTQELVSFIKAELAKGESKETLKSGLLKSNWSEHDIDQAFVTIEQNIPVPPSPTPPNEGVQVSQSQMHLLITVIAFFVFYPAGVICMWVWMKLWPKWLKIVLSLPLLLAPLAIIMGIALIAINPARQFTLANDTNRQSAVNVILNATSQYQVDHQGNPPAGVTATPLDIKSGSGGADICSSLVAKYVEALPIDPTAVNSHYIDCTDYDTNYSISVNANGQVTVSAPNAEKTTISVTR